jgi:pimeloyl-ACP methyl ester carboxylesterase
VFEMMAALRRKPLRADGATIGAAEVAGTIQALSRTPEGAARIPWVAHEAQTGDWTPLLLTMDELGSGGIPTRQLTFWSIVCNEPWARWSPARTRAASRGTYLAERTALDAELASVVCSVWPKAPQPAWSGERVHADVPVLFVVGGADPQDPPANVRDAVRKLPNSRTILLPGGGHGSLHLGCLPRVATQFIERGSAAGLDTRCAARYTPSPFIVR